MVDLVKFLAGYGKTVDDIDEITAETKLSRLAKRGFDLSLVRDQTDEDCLTACTEEGWAVRSAEIRKEAVLLKAIEQSPLAIQFMGEEEKTAKIINAALSRKPEALKFIFVQTEAQCLLAVQGDGLAIRYAQIRSPRVITAALEQNGMALKFLAPKNNARALKACTTTGNALSLRFPQTEEICLTAVNNDGMALEHVRIPQTIAIIKAAMDQNPEAVRFINRAAFAG